MKRLLFDPGMLPINDLLKSLQLFNQKNEITLITESRRKNEYTAIEETFHLVYYSSLQKVSNQPVPAEYIESYSNILTKVLNDHRTLLIAERVHNLIAWISLFNIIQTIEKMVHNSLLLISSRKIDTLLFQATPHNLPTWVLAKTAETIGVKVQMIQTSPLPFRYWIVEGLDKQKHVFPYEIQTDEFDESLLKGYIELNKKDYEGALPEYEKRRLDSRNGKYWSWKKEIKDIIKYPKKIISLPTKRKLFCLYNSLAKNIDLPQQYIVFFLHFQPERTSLPEALTFSHQWLIIKMVSDTLPNGWQLLVKEHPSMYTNNLDFRYRNSNFYKDICSLNNVQLVPLNYNTFELIDSSKAIVTISGTVGVQALIRNKPVLVFGIASYRECNNVHPVTSLKDLINFFTEFPTTNEEVSVENYLESVIKISVNGIDQNRSAEQINYYERKTRINGHLKLLKLFLEV